MLVLATHSTFAAKALASAGQRALHLKTPLHTSGHSRALRRATLPSSSSSTTSFGPKAKTSQSKLAVNPSAHQHSFGNYCRLDIILSKALVSTRAFLCLGPSGLCSRRPRRHRASSHLLNLSNHPNPRSAQTHTKLSSQLSALRPPASELKYSSSSVIAIIRSLNSTAASLGSPPANSFPEPTSSTRTLIRLNGSGI